jgi:dehydrogenase/reductase SDR family protein 1
MDLAANTSGDKPLKNLNGEIAIVTGASRGVGKGVAIGLAEAGAIVYATGRTITEEAFVAGKGIIPVRCDHTSDSEVEAAFQRINKEQDHLDILVNNVWGGYENMMENGEFTWMLPFWKQPLWRWDAMFTAGVRAHYVASAYAARMMVERRGGLIVNISFWAAQKYLSNVAYGVSKAATDKMTADMAHELREFNVAVVSLYPGLVRTEKVLEAAAFLDLSNSESPQFIGRAVAALASDPNVMRKSGQVLVAASLAQEYGFTDVDEKQPRPLSLEDL